jgi:hypothetical protein
MKKAACLIATIAVLALLAGCSTWQGQTYTAENWGRSFESAKFNQTLNPDAGKTLEPVEGLDGTAADHSVESYKTSFKGEKTEQTVNILKLE